MHIHLLISELDVIVSSISSRSFHLVLDNALRCVSERFPTLQQYIAAHTGVRCGVYR